MPWLFVGALLLAFAAVADRKKPKPTEVQAGERWVLMFSWKGGSVTPSIVQDAFGAALSQSAKILSYEFVSGPYFSVDLTYTKPARIGVGQTVNVPTPGGPALLTLQAASLVVPPLLVSKGERWKIFAAFSPGLGTVPGMTKENLRAQVVAAYATFAPLTTINSIVFGDSSMMIDITFGQASRINSGGQAKIALPGGGTGTIVIQSALKVR